MHWYMFYAFTFLILLACILFLYETWNAHKLCFKRIWSTSQQASWFHKNKIYSVSSLRPLSHLFFPWLTHKLYKWKGPKIPSKCASPQQNENSQNQAVWKRVLHDVCEAGLCLSSLLFTSSCMAWKTFHLLVLSHTGTDALPSTILLEL
jgi:hypothetical protein